MKKVMDQNSKYIVKTYLQLKCPQICDKSGQGWARKARFM